MQGGSLDDDRRRLRPTRSADPEAGSWPRMPPLSTLAEADFHPQAFDPRTASLRNNASDGPTATRSPLPGQTPGEHANEHASQQRTERQTKPSNVKRTQLQGPTHHRFLLVQDALLRQAADAELCVNEEVFSRTRPTIVNPDVSGLNQHKPYVNRSSGSPNLPESFALQTPLFATRSATEEPAPCVRTSHVRGSLSAGHRRPARFPGKTRRHSTKRRHERFSLDVYGVRRLIAWGRAIGP